jgi:hypothetical protein
VNSHYQKTSELTSVNIFQVNDFVRDKFMDKNGNLPLYGEVISGACVSDLDSVHYFLKYFACLFCPIDLCNI